jgi:hypothetical protein
MIKKSILTVALMFGFASSANAICYNLSPGLFFINHRSGFLRGGNFRASVRCTRNTPQYVFWRGGTLCDGSTFYGRYLGRSFSCSVRKITR